MSKAESKESDQDIPITDDESIERLEKELAGDLPKLINYKFIPHRVFINHVDSFHSKYIAAYITDQVFGAMKFAGGEYSPLPATVPNPEEPIKNYEFIGTLNEPLMSKGEDILFTVDEEDKEIFMNEILKCGFIIYDITRDANEIQKALDTLTVIEQEYEKIKQVGPKTYEIFPDTRVFILLSTVMTWANTKPLVRNDPEFTFVEEDYRKRRSHPNYKSHLDCEKEMVKKGKKHPGKLKVYVVCTGFTYGKEQDELLFFYKLAFYNEKYLPIFKPGDNYIPVLYIKDLAQILHLIMETQLPVPPYILAVDDAQVTLAQIIKSLSKELGQGKTKVVDPEEAFLYANMTQEMYDHFTINIRMAPLYVRDSLPIKWYNNYMSLPMNMKNIVSEFKTSRNLIPIKIILHGPPASGKTVLAKKFVREYGIHYVNVDSMIKNTMEDLEENIKLEKNRLKEKDELAKREKSNTKNNDEEEEEEEKEEEEDEVGDDDKDNLTKWEDQLREMEEMLDENNKIPENYMINLMKIYLSKNICQNQGYILDGFPETMKQTTDLFGQSATFQGEDGEGDDIVQDIGENILMPTVVISLQATDEFLCNRIMERPEEEIQGTIYDEENMIQRLREFRDNNTEDNTILNFFDEHEIHPILIDTMEETEELNIEHIFKNLCRIIGPPQGFGLSEEEQVELKKFEMIRLTLLKEQQKITKKKLAHQAELERQKKMEEWSTILEQLKIEEEKILAVQSEPLRHYLMKYVFPTLSKGLIEIVRVKPEDPIDYLAEFLFKQNPEGKMFDPSYTRNGELLIEKYKEQIEPVFNKLVKQ